VFGGNDREARAAAAAFEPSEQQIVPAMGVVEGVAVIIAAFRESCALLARLHRLPELAGDDPQLRNLLALPLVGRIGTRQLLFGGRILDVGALVPDELAGIEVVVEDARAALLLAANGCVEPWAIFRPRHVLRSAALMRHPPRSRSSGTRS